MRGRAGSGDMATILLVEDDPLQASVRKSILEQKFPDVRRVNDAAEALCLVEQPEFARNLCLVVTGHHLSGIGGPAFVAELHTRIPLLPVLVVDDTSERHSDYPGDSIRFLSRSFRAEELLTLARQMLLQNQQKTA